MEPVIVRLSEEEIAHAIQVANSRDENSKLKGYQDNHGYGDYPEDIKEKNSKRGSMAEKALAKFLGEEWPPKNSGFQCADVGTNLQVKSIEKPYHKLIVRPNSNPQDKYVLVLADKIPEFTVLGWILAKDARQDRWIKQPDSYEGKERPPAWFVPQYALKSAWALKEII